MQVLKINKQIKVCNWFNRWVNLAKVTICSWLGIFALIIWLMISIIFCTNKRISVFIKTYTSIIFYYYSWLKFNNFQKNYNNSSLFSNINSLNHKKIKIFGLNYLIDKYYVVYVDHHSFIPISHIKLYFVLFLVISYDREIDFSIFVYSNNFRILNCFIFIVDFDIDYIIIMIYIRQLNILFIKAHALQTDTIEPQCWVNLQTMCYCYIFM